MSSPEAQGVSGEEYAIGTKVLCGEQECGELERVVVDPLTRRLTHLVVGVRPTDDPRLVPLELVVEAGERIRLSCTEAELDALEPAEDVRFLGPDDAPWTFGPGDTLFWPYYALGGSDPLGGAFGLSTPPAVVHERIPRGEVALRRGDPVRAVDGDVGRVRGLVIDRSDDHVTHVLLEEGHLWGKKQVAVPITAVTGMDEAGASVNLTTQQIRDLPPVEIDGGGTEKAAAPARDP